MSKSFREEEVINIRVIAQRKCNYCGLTVDSDVLPIGWVSLSCQCEYNYFVETEMCPECAAIKGIIVDKDHYE